MLMIGCFGYLADLVAIYILPGFKSTLTPYLAFPAGLAEISFLLWLLVKGAKVQPQDESAPATVRGQLANTV